MTQSTCHRSTVGFCIMPTTPTINLLVTTAITLSFLSLNIHGHQVQTSPTGTNFVLVSLANMTTIIIVSDTFPHYRQHKLYHHLYETSEHTGTILPTTGRPYIQFPPLRTTIDDNDRSHTNCHLHVCSFPLPTSGTLGQHHETSILQPVTARLTLYTDLQPTLIKTPSFGHNISAF